MESWRTVWRKAVAPLMPHKGLVALRDALLADDPSLLQGATTSPPPLACVQDWDVEAACLVGFCGWKNGLKTVGEVEEFFAKCCYKIDQTLCEPAGCRWFLNFWDETPRHELIQLLLPEVELALAEGEPS
jgi:hypothetical protein